MTLESMHLSDVTSESSHDVVPDISPLSVDESTPVINYRTRTLDYDASLPYQVETPADALAKLDTIVQRLIVSVDAGDFYIGAAAATSDLGVWLSLKFALPREIHIQLVCVYYDLSLSIEVHRRTVHQFVVMFVRLVQYRHALRPGHLILDWVPIWKIIRSALFVQDSLEQYTYIPYNIAASDLHSIIIAARRFFDPTASAELIDLVLPHFSMDFVSKAFSAVGVLNLMLPNFRRPPTEPRLNPFKMLPTFFYLWSNFAHSRAADVQFLSLFCRMASESIESPDVEFGEFGIFTDEQSTEIFNAILRFLCLNYSSTHSPYRSSTSPSQHVFSIMSDPRGELTMSMITTFIISSISASCLDKERSVFVNLETLIQTIKPFFHPSLQNVFLSDLIASLCVNITHRWLLEQSGELKVPEHKRLSRAVIRRFVHLMRELPLIGIFSKSSHDERRALTAIEYLAFLEPTMVLPRALRLIYPALQDASPAHRTKSCIKTLSVLSWSLAQTKGFRCHIAFLLGMLLPAIDPNDPAKTRRTLGLIQTISQVVPMHNLQTDHKKLYPDSDEPAGSFLAQQWFQSEMARLEDAPEDFEIDYDAEMTDDHEEMILRQTTAGLEDYVREFITKLFALSESMCGSTQSNSTAALDKTEASVVNSLSLMSLSFFPSLSPELFEVALETVSKKIHDWSVQNARSSVSVVCNALYMVDPARTMEVLLPSVVENIRIEVLENGAGTARGLDEILPRDQRLVYYIRLLSNLVGAGWAVRPWIEQLVSLIEFLQDNCRGPVNRYVDALIGKCLGGLATTRPRERFLFDPEVRLRGVAPKDWGRFPDPRSVSFEWYVPGPDEINTAIDMFYNFTVSGIDRLAKLTGPDPPIKMDGKGKEWTDEVTRILSMLMDMLEGTSTFVDPTYHGTDSSDNLDNPDVEMTNGGGDSPDWNSVGTFDSIVGNPDRSAIGYEYGYCLTRGSAEYIKFHEVRTRLGYALHRLHRFLHSEAEDNFVCLTLVSHVMSTFLIDVGIPRLTDTYGRYSDWYLGNQKRFKYKGMRKSQPRSSIILRLNLHHLARANLTTMTRPRSKLDIVLLNDLVMSSVFSSYRLVRVYAQHLLCLPMRMIASSSVFIVHRVLTALDEAIEKKELRAVKGALYTLMLYDVQDRLRHEWHLAARFVKSYLRTFDLDKAKAKLPDLAPAVFRRSTPQQTVTPPSLRTLARYMFSASVLARLEIEVAERTQKTESVLGGKRSEMMRQYAQTMTRTLAENSSFALDGDKATTTEWPMKKTNLVLDVISQNALVLELPGSDEMIDRIFAGLVSPTPFVREASVNFLGHMFNILADRIVSGFDRQNWEDMETVNPSTHDVPIDPNTPTFMADFLKRTNSRNPPDFVDSEYGWLVWSRRIKISDADPKPVSFPVPDSQIRSRMGSHIDRVLFDRLLSFAKVEPTGSQDDIRSELVTLYVNLFLLMFAGQTTATFADLTDSVGSVLADKDDKNCHRARAEVMGALIQCMRLLGTDHRNAVWDYVLPFLRDVMSGQVRNEVLEYWLDLVDSSILEHDPRRSQPVIDLLTQLPTEIGPDEMLKRQALFEGLRRMVRLSNWYFQIDSQIVDLLMGQLTNPYKAIRGIVGNILALYIHRKHHPSYTSIEALHADQSVSSVGRDPYEPSAEMTTFYAEIVRQLDEWQAKHVPNQTEPTEYRSGGKTILTCLRMLVFSPFCGLVTDLLTGPLFQHLLFMADIREDPELPGLAADLLLSLPVIPYRIGQDVRMVDNIVRVGRESTNWHHRFHVLALVSTLHYQRQFMLPADQKTRLLEAVIAMLSDTQIDVRKAASQALAAMVQCMPLPARTVVIADLQDRLGKIVAQRIPKPKRRIHEALSPASLVADAPAAKTLAQAVTVSAATAVAAAAAAPAGNSNTANSTGSAPAAPTDNNETAQAIAIRRHHGAVLGLGSLVLAFPFASPPPRWMPAVLNVLANKAMTDTGVVARSAKWFLAEFRKTRQDTWFIDSKAFQPDELVNLEGVVQVSYFA